MKITINQIKDSSPFTKEAALERAKNKLKETNQFAAVYGKSRRGKQTYFLPIIMSENDLKAYIRQERKEDPDATVYVLYRANLEDAPIYEIEYKKGEAYVDIPDEEIEEFCKNRLIEIANNPRLMKKYESNIKEMLEEELQEYANKQFYEKGRGEAWEDSYRPRDDLLIIYNASEGFPINWNYEANEDSVAYHLDNWLEREDFYLELDPEEREKYLDENWDDLCEKYFNKLKEEFKEKAKDEAWTWWNDYGKHDPDYRN